MLYPEIDKIREKADSKYTLCVIASKRARDIVEARHEKFELEKEKDGSKSNENFDRRFSLGEVPIFTDSDTIRPVSIAAYEIFEDQISYKREEEK